jgi:hypothetical protein
MSSELVNRVRVFLYTDAQRVLAPYRARNILVTPTRPTPRSEALLVQVCGDLAERMLACAQLVDACDRRLFGLVRLNVHAIRCQPASILIADAFALPPFVVQCVPRAFADRFTFPLAHGRHDVQDQAPGGRTGIQRLRYRHQRYAAPLVFFPAVCTDPSRFS